MKPDSERTFDFCHRCLLRLNHERVLCRNRSDDCGATLLQKVQPRARRRQPRTRWRFDSSCRFRRVYVPVLAAATKRQVPFWPRPPVEFRRVHSVAPVHCSYRLSTTEQSIRGSNFARGRDRGNPSFVFHAIVNHIVNHIVIHEAPSGGNSPSLRTG